MDRRHVVIALGYLATAAAGMPRRALGQQRRIPVVGFLRLTSQSESQYLVNAFRAGLAEAGLIENKDVSIEYRFANDQHDRMPSLAKEFVDRKVDVVLAGGVPAALAAKSASATIPVVFAIGEDPIRMGLVDSLSHPGGNVTGVTFLDLAAKRLELFHMLVPKIKTIAFLADPKDRQSLMQVKDTQDAAHALGVDLVVFEASSEDEIEAVFAQLNQKRMRALQVSGGGLFLGKRDRIVSLALQHSILLAHPLREAAKAGALMSYNASISDAYRQAGLYGARILKGASPRELPVLQAQKTELTINLRTAKALGLAVPQAILQRADEVIE